MHSIYGTSILEEQKKLEKLLPPGTYTTFYYLLFFLFRKKYLRYHSNDIGESTRTTSVNLPLGVCVRVCASACACAFLCVRSCAQVLLYKRYLARMSTGESVGKNWGIEVEEANVEKDRWSLGTLLAFLNCWGKVGTMPA